VKTKELQVHFSIFSIYIIIPVPDYMPTASNESVASEQWTEIDLEGNNHGIIGKCTEISWRCWGHQAEQQSRQCVPTWIRTGHFWDKSDKLNR